MKPRVIGVATALAAITIVFTAIVLTIATIQDYQENKGESFIERAASIVGFGTLTEDVAEVKVEMADEDVAEPEKRSSDPPDIFRFFGRSEGSEESFDGWEFQGFVPPDLLDDLVERGVMTQDEADQIQSWLENLPDSVSETMPKFLGNRSFEFDSDDGSFRFRGEWNFGEPEDDSTDEHKDDKQRRRQIRTRSQQGHLVLALDAVQASAVSRRSQPGLNMRRKFDLP